MRSPALLSVLIASSALACGGGTGMYAPGKAASKSSSTAPAGSKGKGKFDFKAEMSKEASGLKPMPLTAPDGSFTATVSASAAPKITPADESSFSVAVEIGATRPMDCAIFKKRVDPATTVWNLAVEPLTKYPKTEVLGAEIGADDDRSVLTLNMAALNDENEALVMKVTLVALADATVICRHDEIGYAATTKTATLELGRTLKMNRPGRPPRYHELAVVKVNDRTVGFTERFLLDGEDGVTFEMEYGATLATIEGAPDVLAQDDVTVTECDKEGLVKTVTKGEGTPKGLSKKLVLQRKGGTDYEVDGEVEGNKVHTKLKSKKPLRGSVLTSQDVVANARLPKAAPLVEESWSSSTPPGEIATGTYTRMQPFDANAPKYLVKTGGEEFTMTFDAQGAPRHLTGKHEDVSVEMTRLFAKGTLQRKK